MERRFPFHGFLFRKGDYMTIVMDLHNHSEFSFDSITPMEENIKRAIELGINYLSITDHLDLYYPEEDYREKIDLKGYFEKYKRLKELYEQEIHLLAGIEVGIQTITREVNEEITNSFSFDFVIGFIHEIDGKDLVTDDVIQKFRDLKDFYKYYYEETQKAVEDAQDFDILGHIDYMDRYVGDYKDIPDISLYEEYLIPTLKSLISRNKGIEINTAGVRKGLPYMHPKEQILEWYQNLGGTIITLGSDAHKAEDIGKGIEEATKLLQQKGFKTVSIFENRIEKKIEI